MDLRSRLKDVATDLFVARGYNGVSFSDIAEAVSTTRANIHHHFGGKMDLAEELIRDAADSVLERYGQIFTRHRTTLREKMAACLAFNRERYDRYNPADEGRPWSLITRFRLDAAHLSPRILAELQRVSEEIEALVAFGVRMAVDNGEFAPDAPQDKMRIQLATLLRFNQFVVTDAGRFQALTDLYDAVLESLQRAYANTPTRHES